MPRYEYDFEDFSTVTSTEELFASLNARGKKSWRLMSPDLREGIAMFERVLPEDASGNDEPSGPVPLNEDTAFYSGPRLVANNETPASH